MKRRYKYLGAGIAAGVMLTVFSGAVFAAVKDGPGMADGRTLLSEGDKGGVIRRDSGAGQLPAESGQETGNAPKDDALENLEELPGVPVDSLEGLTYDIRKLAAAQGEDVEQMIVIAGHDGTYARVTLYQKNLTGSDPTQYQWTVLVDSEGRMGRNGMGKQIEGDEKTPVGLYTAGLVFGNKENPGTALPYTHVTPAHYWVGDSNSPYYNQFVDINVTGDVFDKGKSEHLSAYGAVYNYCLDMGYNTAGTPHMGSALFLHCTNGYGTAGCVGIPEEAMAEILRQLKPGAKVLLDLSENIGNY